MAETSKTFQINDNPPFRPVTLTFDASDIPEEHQISIEAISAPFDFVPVEPGEMFELSKFVRYSTKTRESQYATFNEVRLFPTTSEGELIESHVQVDDTIHHGSKLATVDLGPFPTSHVEYWRNPSFWIAQYKKHSLPDNGSGVGEWFCLGFPFRDPNLWMELLPGLINHEEAAEMAFLVRRWSSTLHPLCSSFKYLTQKEYEGLTLQDIAANYRLTDRKEGRRQLFRVPDHLAVTNPEYWLAYWNLSQAEAKSYARKWKDIFDNRDYWEGHLYTNHDHWPGHWDNPFPKGSFPRSPVQVATRPQLSPVETESVDAARRTDPNTFDTEWYERFDIS